MPYMKNRTQVKYISRAYYLQIVVKVAIKVANVESQGSRYRPSNHSQWSGEMSSLTLRKADAAV